MKSTKHTLCAALLVFLISVSIYGIMLGLLVGSYKFYKEDETAFVATLWVFLAATFAIIGLLWYIFRTKKVKEETEQKKRQQELDEQTLLKKEQEAKNKNRVQ